MHMDYIEIFIERVAKVGRGDFIRNNDNSRHNWGSKCIYSDFCHNFHSPFYRTMCSIFPHHRDLQGIEMELRQGQVLFRAHSSAFKSDFNPSGGDLWRRFIKSVVNSRYLSALFRYNSDNGSYCSFFRNFCDDGISGFYSHFHGGICYKVGLQCVETDLCQTQVLLQTHSSAFKSDFNPSGGDLWHKFIKSVVNSRYLSALFRYNSDNGSYCSFFHVFRSQSYYYFHFYFHYRTSSILHHQMGSRWIEGESILSETDSDAFNHKLLRWCVHCRG